MTRTSELPVRIDTEAAADDPRAAIAALQRTVSRLEARVAQLEQPPAQWLRLKLAAYHADIKYETARKWAERGLVGARREGKGWLVNVASLKARKARWASQLSAAKRTNNVSGERFGP